MYQAVDLDVKSAKIPEKSASFELLQDIEKHRLSLDISKVQLISQLILLY